MTRVVTRAVTRAVTTIFFLVAFLFSNTALSRNDVNDYSIKDVLSQERAKELLGNDVKFYFGKQRYGKVLRKHGVRSSNKKTNAFNKTDQEACEWVFLSAMVAMRNSALKSGANAVVNIQSNYRGNKTSSEKTFKCGAGAFVAGVALTGSFVTLKK